MNQKPQSNNSKHNMMGVINITPNSFSDGGKFNSTDGFKALVSEFTKWNVTLFDIGAESTAPFNDPISLEEERSRLVAYLMSNLDSIPKNSTLSIDTYKPDLFCYIYREIKAKRDDLSLWWNDVSGVLDDALFDVLSECPDARYIFCHTLVPNRSETSNHMDYAASDIDISLQVLGRLKKCLSDFQDRGIVDRLILDPCFGFSKTLEQNYTLIKELPQLISVFDEQIPWVVGISRKSFLKKAVPFESSDSSAVAISEMMHSIVAERLMKMLPDRELYFRMHDPAVYFSAKFVADTI